MNYPVDTINFVLALGVVAIQIKALYLLGAIVLRKKNRFAAWTVKVAGDNALGIAFILALGSFVISLFYSEVLGFAPCGLCWLQRVAIYPQLFLFITALIKGDEKIADYSIVLSVAGLIISLYQHALQLGASEFVPCATTLLAADCAKKTLFEFGYITFPLMAASVCAYLIVLMITLKIRNR
jgi:disulfide bond formation protein DsbB